MRRDQDQVRPQDLDGLPVFDLTDQNDWMECVEGMVRIRSRRKRYRAYTGNLEPLLQDDLVIKILERTNGDSWREEHLGIPGRRAAVGGRNTQRTPAGGLGATR
jgi:hypothetical protein